MRFALPTIPAKILQEIRVDVGVHYKRSGNEETIDREFDGELDDQQRARLADIAERTPVTLTLKHCLPIVTTLE